jgi:hypothetical protein
LPAGLVIAVVTVCMMLAVTAIVRRSEAHPARTREEIEAESFAEAGIRDKISQMIAGDLGNLGSASEPARRAGGTYWVRVDEVDRAGRLYRLTSRARIGATAIAVEAVVQPVGGRTEREAVFAGNDADDPRYRLEFVGAGPEADRIVGDVVCGGSVRIAGEARVEGRVRAAGPVLGAGGRGRSLPRALLSAPDFVSLHRTLRPDVDVSASLAGARVGSSAVGGNAGQLPPEDPAHVFRRNPSDREDLTRSTPVDDYFLEDPYETLDLGSGARAWLVTPVDSRGEPGAAGAVPGAGLVYFVRGDVWIASRTGDAVLMEAPAGGRSAMTLVVRGDVHIASDLLVRDPSRDAISIVALRDPDRTGSGNVFVGDRRAGAPSRIEAFVFAENDVRYAAHPGGARGPDAARLQVRGCLVAGNQVQLGSEADQGRIQLTVLFDAEAATLLEAQRGIPSTLETVAAYSVVSTRRLAGR